MSGYIRLSTGEPAFANLSSPELPEVLKSVVVAKVGEAKTHHFSLDRTTLSMLAALGNDKSGGLKVHMGHPTMCDDGIGKLAGRASNFHLSPDGDALLADIKFLDSARRSPNGDLPAYLASAAKEAAENPDHKSNIMLSLVSVFDFVRLAVDPKNNKVSEISIERDARYKYKPAEVLARPTSFSAVDFVDDGAATDGLYLSADIFGPAAPSAELSKFMSTFLSKPDAVERAIDFLSKHINHKDKDMDIKTEPVKTEPTPALPATDALAANFKRKMAVAYALSGLGIAAEKLGITTDTAPEYDEGALAGAKAALSVAPSNSVPNVHPQTTGTAPAVDPTTLASGTGPQTASAPSAPPVDMNSALSARAAQIRRIYPQITADEALSQAKSDFGIV